MTALRDELAEWDPEERPTLMAENRRLREALGWWLARDREAFGRGDEFRALARSAAPAKEGQ